MGKLSFAEETRSSDHALHGSSENQAWVRIAEISEVEENKKGSKRD